MISLTSQQAIIYKALFNPSSRVTKSHQCKEIKELGQASTALFGYNIFDCSFVNEAEKKNLCYYLENIVLHTKFITYLVEDHKQHFKDFYSKVAEFCLKVIQAFNEEVSSKNQPYIYTDEFKQHLQETILSSLEVRELDIERIQGIFCLKISIITHTAFLRHNASENLLKPIPELLAEIRNQRNRVEEAQYISNLCSQIDKIIKTNQFPPLALDSTKHKLTIWQENESQNIEKFICQRNPTATKLRMLTVLLAIVTVYMIRDPLFPFFFVMTALSLLVASIAASKTPKNDVVHARLKQALEDKEENLKEYLTLESIDYGVKEDTPRRIYSFKPLQQSHEPTYEPPSQPHTIISKIKKRKLLPSSCPQLQEKEVTKKQELQKLPEGYYQSTTPGQLVFVSPDKIDLKGSERDLKISHETFFKNPYIVRRMDEQEQKKWKWKCPDAVYKLKSIARRTGNTTRYFGVEEQKFVNGKEMRVCEVRYCVPKAHT